MDMQTKAIYLSMLIQLLHNEAITTGTEVWMISKVELQTEESFQTSAGSTVWHVATICSWAEDYQSATKTLLQFDPSLFNITVCNSSSSKHTLNNPVLFRTTTSSKRKYYLKAKNTFKSLIKLCYFKNKMFLNGMWIRDTSSLWKIWSGEIEMGRNDLLPLGLVRLIGLVGQWYWYTYPKYAWNRSIGVNFIWIFIYIYV